MDHSATADHPDGPWVEAIPNFSEGRDLSAIESIAQALDSHGARVLHLDSNEDANRSVITLAGRLNSVCRALFDGISRALECIDMRTHEGAHIRIGAADVVPVVPLYPSPAALSRCVLEVEALAERLVKEHRLPIFLYEGSARRSSFAALPRCRRGGYEALASRFQDGGKDGSDGPDLGPSNWTEASARSGATVIGLRDLLVAMNFTLDTSEVAVAQGLARSIRSAGPKDRPNRIPALRAVGWLMPGYGGLAQVSTNLIDPRVTAAHDVLAALRRLSPVPVLGSELIGLCPSRILRDAALVQRGEPVPLWASEEVLDIAAADQQSLIQEGAIALGLDHLSSSHDPLCLQTRMLESALLEAGLGRAMGKAGA